MEPKPKTYKREVAFGLFLALGFLVFTDNVPMVEILVWPVFTFAALAYGLDWHGRQNKNVPWMHKEPTTTRVSQTFHSEGRSQERMQEMPSYSEEDLEKK